MRLLSWNIQWGRGLDGRVDLARIAAGIHALGPFDVICLQEVSVNFDDLPGSRGEDELALLAGLLPGYVACYLPAVDLPDGNGGRKQFGNAIFSRLPVCQVFRHLLPWPAEPDVPSMQRGLLEVVLETGMGPLRVMTTHLEYYSRSMRLAQIAAIRALHAQACAHARLPHGAHREQGSFAQAPRTATAVLCGDMNFAAQAEERARLLLPFADGTPGFRDSWEILHPGMPHAPTVGIHPVDFVNAPVCFDFFFLSEDLAPRLLAHGIDRESAASDHQPVWIELAEN